MNKKPAPPIFHATKRGKVYLGDSLDLMETMKANSVDLIVTSPPFALTGKKEYGNEQEDEYLRWFRPFGDAFRRILKNSGSLVIDLGGAWKPGFPVRSLYHFKLLIMLCEEFGFTPRARILLVESFQTADAGGMGERSPHPGQGRY